jgi:hypothetical protein
MKSLFNGTIWSKADPANQVFCRRYPFLTITVQLFGRNKNNCYLTRSDKSSAQLYFNLLSWFTKAVITMLQRDKYCIARKFEKSSDKL